LLAAFVLLAAAPAWSQEWRASARFGRVTYEGAPAGTSVNSSAVLGVGRSGPRDWLGVSAALPLGEDPFWAVVGGWKRFAGRGASGLLLDATGHGFVQRTRAASTAGPGPTRGPFPIPTPTVPPESDLSGEGAGGELMAGAFAASPRGLRVEARGGVAAQRSRLGNVIQERALPTGDVRVSLPLAPFALGTESRAWLDDSVTHTYLGGTLNWGRGPVQVYASLGQWVSGGVDHTAWSLGAGVAVAPGMELQLGGRGHAFDPLYLSATETSFWAGLSLRLGGRAAHAPLPARTRDGQAVIAIPAPSAKGTPSIAGDFTEWKPVPMQRQGSRWTWTAALKPGVYRYAFVAEDGSWFVPASVAGRQDDGMGGQVAVLVVP
jgi:hypothetical protein